MTTNPLAAAIDHIRSVTNRAWCAEDFEEIPGNPVDASIATILNAVVDGQLMQAPSTCALDRALRAEAGLIADDGADVYGTDDPIAAAQALIADAIGFACASNHYLAGQDPEKAQQWRDALATLADALEAERAENAKLTVEIDMLEAEAADFDGDYSKAVAERDQALARLATAHREAIERCAALLIELGYVSESGETLANEVRGLRVDPDAQAALDKLLAEARLEGWRAGRNAAADEALTCRHDPYVIRAIRALPEPKEASHD